MGMDAATVRPARRPTYTVTAPKMMPKMDPSKERAEGEFGPGLAGRNKGLELGHFSASKGANEMKTAFP
jgi:hypothetical protein